MMAGKLFRRLQNLVCDLRIAALLSACFNPTHKYLLLTREYQDTTKMRFSQLMDFKLFFCHERKTEN
jgi:hypothetical protein